MRGALVERRCSAMKLNQKAPLVAIYSRRSLCWIFTDAQGATRAVLESASKPELLASNQDSSVPFFNVPFSTELVVFRMTQNNYSTGIWDSICFASVHHLAKAGAVAVPVPTATGRVAVLGSLNCFKSCAAVGDPRCSGTSNVSRCSPNIGASASGAPNPSNPPDCPCEPLTSPPLSMCRPCAHRTRCCCY